MHLHLKNCLHDYGPVYSFWCFAFERYNGILGAYHTNNKQIEPQIMRKFLKEKQLRSSDLPQEYGNFIDVLPQSHDSKGSLECAKCSGNVHQLIHLSSPLQPSLCDYSLSDVENLIPPITEKVLPNALYMQLCEVYKQLYPQYKIAHASRSYMYSRRASIGDVLVSASFNKKLSVVAVYWAGRGSDISNFDIGRKRIGSTLYLLKHTVSLTSTNLSGDAPLHTTANITRKTPAV